MEFRYRFQGQPWVDEGRSFIPDGVFIQEVEDALAKTGRWETYGEYRMGAGPTVSVTVSEKAGQTVYEAESIWMAWDFRIVGGFNSLDRALVALGLFADAQFQILSDGGWEGLVDR